jgi:lipoprotein-anchoring transpeptidase ErfK/SrfK
VTSQHFCQQFRNRVRPLVGLTTIVVAAALAVSACGSDTPGSGSTKTVTQTAGANGSTSAGSSSASSGVSSAPVGRPVKVSSGVIGDGAQVGVGMPIILLLSRKITDARLFAKATRVTVNGHRVVGGWFFERKYQDAGHPVEADYRLQGFWPGHARIHMDLLVKGLSAGPGLVFANSLTLDFSTGAANVLTVDNATHRLTVVSDGKRWGSSFPVSLGAGNTRTRRGTKVIMEKGNSICMHGPGYNECGVRWTQRLTYDGEYLHAAPWNTANISRGINSSNGCTNLYTQDAKKLYDFLEVGDVVKYPDANGLLMQIGDGYGDWNVPWAQWKTGGLYPVA